MTDMITMNQIASQKGMPVVKKPTKVVDMGVFVFCLFLNGGVLVQSPKEMAVVTAFGASVVIMCNLLQRLSLFVEELRASDCGIANLKDAFVKSILKWNVFSYIFIFLVIINLILISSFGEAVNVEIVPFAISIISFFILSNFIHMSESPTWEAHLMERLGGLDYGSGMAHSYFYGYLKIILPAKGDNNKSLRERIDIFIDENRLKNSQFPVRKLVILIPRSGYSYPTLGDDSSLPESTRSIEPCEKLQDILRDRAGSQGRVYRGGAYRIRVPPQTSYGGSTFLYVVAEGATPIQTFYEAYSSGSKNADHLKQLRDVVISQFCTTLQELIDSDPECRNLAELIPYDDAYGKNDVSQLLRWWLLERSPC